MPDTATAEAPVTEAPMTPLGAVYEEALAKEQGKEPKAAPVVAPEKAEEEVEIPPAEKIKPASALDAALEAPTEKKPDTTEDFPEELPNQGRKDHWKRAREKMAADREALQEREKAIGDLKTQLGQAKENPEVKAALDKLTEENAILRDAIAAANVELLPEFRAKYIEGRDNLIGKAADKLKAYGGNPEALKEALTMPEGRRRDIAIREAMGEDMDDLAKTKINGIIAQLDTLNDEAQNERANSRQSYERLTAKQQEQRAAQAQEIETRKTQTFYVVSKQLQTEVPTLRLVDPSIPGAEDWNNGVNAAFEQSQRLFSDQATPEETVAIAVKGSRYDALEKMFLSTRTELAQAKKELAAYDGSQPDVKGGKGPVKKGAEASLDESPGDIFKRTMAALSNPAD